MVPKAPLLLILTLGAAALPATASAAAPWSPAEPIPGSADAFPDLAFTGNGQGVATWTAGGGPARAQAFGAR